MSDDELKTSIQKMCSGDKAAFQMIYEESRDHVFRMVSFLIHNKHDVCDVVSEVYTELFKTLPKYKTEKPFRAWLNGLIIRQTNNWNRKIWRRFRLQRRSQLLDLDPHLMNTDQVFLQNEHRNELIARVHKLSYKHSVVIVLRYFQDYSFEEIAAILAIPVGTVKSRHHIALEKLRKQSNEEVKEMKEASRYVH
jgi:RNA polymerase sigma-70 factor (ECF subfamily)